MLTSTLLNSRLKNVERLAEKRRRQREKELEEYNREKENAGSVLKGDTPKARADADWLKDRPTVGHLIEKEKRGKRELTNIPRPSPEPIRLNRRARARTPLKKSSRSVLLPCSSSSSSWHVSTVFC